MNTLTIIGVLLTVLLSGPVVVFISRRYRDIQRRQRWPADLQVEKKVISKLDHYAYESWYQKIDVDAKGNATHSIDMRLVNIGTSLLKELFLPIYCDAIDVPENEIKPWARCGRKKLESKVDCWIPERARGRIRINIYPPLPPGGRRRIKWGYFLPRTFHRGDEHYNWDISNLHYELRAKLNFHPSWSILYARWDDVLAKSQETPKSTPSSIEYVVRFPEKGKRVQLRMGLSQKVSEMK